MIKQETIESILSIDITDVIGKHVQLKKAGVNYQGCCPFHNEKTPSFVVSPAKGMFKCFGCGKAGNAIGFVMEHKGISYPEAIRMIAADRGIQVQEEEQTPEQQKRSSHRERLFAANKLAAEWFQKNLHLPENKAALDYVKGRWSDDSISTFQIGYAPDDWHRLMNTIKEKAQVIPDEFIEAGLISESKGKTFDFFRGRIMFPIHDHLGRVVAFTGRKLDDTKEGPKYYNSPETEIYSKGSVLYGMNFSRRATKERGYVHLVEGNPDVIRLHEIGKLNTVGTCGTSLTREQIELIKSRCNSVTIIGDSDKAGKKAMERSGKLLVEAGLFVNIVPLPDEEKADPDSFFSSDDQFDEYLTDHIQDFIIWMVEGLEHKAKNPDAKSKIIDQVAQLIISLPESSTELYLDKLSKIIKPKKAWQDAIKAYKADNVEVKDDGWRIPDNVLLSDFEKYGFYDDGHCYFFKTKAGVVRGTNFTMEPLFHISSVLNAKRLYRITNEFGFSQVIELAQKDLIGLAAFRLRVESLGNFLFEAGETELNKLKRFLYEKTESCFEIAQMGWQKNGFWAWCNGIYNGKFTPVDSNGIVKYQDENFYLPASSNIYQGEETLFVSERRFRHIDTGKISMKDYASKLIEVFGENAMFGICFYMASLFRDHIVKIFGFFPILNLFGPKGAGKTELAISLMQFFGNQAKGPNMTNTTKAALADHVGMTSNACSHLDEYKNNLEYEKIEFLKGIWDGTGRTRMNMDKDRKKETTHVDCGVILSGQEMPTADIALFSRLVFLSFTKYEYTDIEKENFKELKALEKAGLTHITQEILSHRSDFLENFMENYQKTSKLIGSLLGKVIIEDRIFNNWVVIIAAYRTLKNKVLLPFTEEELLQNAVTLITRQNSETKKSNELSIFWSIVEFLANDGLIKEEVDYKIDCVNFLKTDTMNAQFNQPIQVLYINHSRLFQLYRVHGNKTKENIIPLKTLEYYLQHSKEYMGKKGSVAFRVEENGKIVKDEVDTADLHGNKMIQKRKITTAFAFNYDMLGINLITTTDKVESMEEAFSEKEPF
jgi:DNA primase